MPVGALPCGITGARRRPGESHSPAGADGGFHRPARGLAIVSVLPPVAHRNRL